MKYFTREIWAGWQRTGRAGDRAERQWKTNRALYLKSIRQLASRLGARTGKFFTDHSLHDGRILRFSIFDLPLSSLKKKMVPVTSLRMAVLAGWETAVIYLLDYGEMREISIQPRNDLFPLDHSQFGDWGYDELLPEGRQFFRHNILFQTGTEISIVFRKFGFRRQKASNRALRMILRS
jgi:hypothetical protein